MRTVRRPTPKSVPALYGGLTGALVLVIAAVAVVVQSTATPSIAEFGPSADEQITESRQDQGRAATATGGPGSEGACAEADVACAEREAADAAVADEAVVSTSTTLGVEVAAGRRCFGDPPRQTEDPHSPPCVFQIFRGDNGGSTASGVTGSEIRIAVPLPNKDDKVYRETMDALFAHFNRRYEFYGRRLAPEYLSLYPFDTAAANEAGANDVIAAKPFAMVSAFLHWSTNAIIHRRLAEADIISSVSAPVGFSSSDIIEGRTWLVDPPMDSRLRTGGRFVCRILNGHDARHAGADLQGVRRKFAVVVLTESSGGPDPKPLVETLEGCNAPHDVFQLPYWSLQSDFTTLMSDLKLNGFTTVIPVSPTVHGDIYQGATRTGFFPEFFDVGISSTHIEYVWGGPSRTSTAGHGQHAFGVVPDVRVRNTAESPASAAFREGGGEQGYWPDPWYDPLLVIAAGIQAAGPNLNPDTFAAGLRATKFPNPNPGAPPYWQQRVGFGRGDLAFHDDYAIWWWNENAPSQHDFVGETGRGSFCYIDRGARFTAETFPDYTDARLHDTSLPCR